MHMCPRLELRGGIRDDRGNGGAARLLGVSDRHSCSSPRIPSHRFLASMLMTLMSPHLLLPASWCTHLTGMPHILVLIVSRACAAGTGINTYQSTVRGRARAFLPEWERYAARNTMSYGLLVHRRTGGQKAVLLRSRTLLSRGLDGRRRCAMSCRVFVSWGAGQRHQRLRRSGRGVLPRR